MRCPRCQAENPERASFSMACGHDLSRPVESPSIDYSHPQPYTPKFLADIRDVLAIHERTGIPVLFDAFHHSILNNGEKLREALAFSGETWNKRDGVPMVDYSHQKKGHRAGTHADSLDLAKFRRFVSVTKGINFDLMLEIKDKERSTLRALAVLRQAGRSRSS